MFSGKSSDMRDVIAAMEAGDHDATLAYEMYVDRIQKHIGQYLAVLNGADAIIFTAGIGENSTNVREDVISGISWFGCDVDPEKKCLWCHWRYLNRSSKCTCTGNSNGRGIGHCT